MNSVINFAEKLALVDEQWSPRVVAESNHAMWSIPAMPVEN